LSALGDAICELEKVLTHPVNGLENYAEMIRLLTETNGAIKSSDDLEAQRSLTALRQTELPNLIRRLR